MLKAYNFIDGFIGAVFGIILFIVLFDEIFNIYSANILYKKSDKNFDIMINFIVVIINIFALKF